MLMCVGKGNNKCSVKKKGKKECVEIDECENLSTALQSSNVGFLLL